MLELLWLIPALPFAGFAVLAMAGRSLSRGHAAAVGVGSVALSAVLSAALAAAFVLAPPRGRVWVQALWTWMEASGLRAGIAFVLDPLALVFVLVITFVGFLIHLYAVEYMRQEEDISRFFAWMNLFVGSMLTVVLADNLLLLYLGWEGVGLCSYLLIGFWYGDPANGYAARKAFVVTRIGDVALVLGIFMLSTDMGTLHIQDLMGQASRTWGIGSPRATVAALLILGGALGKSAQLPLQTWLPDAMAGPTPVSALIHAATMVTAGVYLIARLNVLFGLAPAVQATVAIIGAATLLLAGCSALVQRDIKRVLAYSTMSQIGYMFLALGAGAWTAAIFHFLVHAFFKALLFLAAGTVMMSLHDERDIFKMGGLRRRLPLAFWTFLIGAASLSAVPLVTAGFYSKEFILLQIWQAPHGGAVLWTAGAVGAFLTSLYIFRVVFLVFFGESRTEVRAARSLYLTIPLVILAGFAIGGGFLETPHFLGGISVLNDFLRAAPASPSVPGAGLLLEIIASCASLGGIYAAYLFYSKKPGLAASIRQAAAFRLLAAFWFSGWGFDWLYDSLIVLPFARLARANRNDFIDLVPEALSRSGVLFHRALSRTQSGNVRQYAAAIALGAIAMIALAVFR